MPNKIITAIAAIGALYFLGTQTTLAAPMLCSGEQKSCVTACQLSPRALIPDCVTNCRTRFNYCRATGCWDNGKNRYCGLGRQ
jgi:hypothetical protein